MEELEGTLVLLVGNLSSCALTCPHWSGMLQIGEKRKNCVLNLGRGRKVEIVHI